MAYRDLYEKQVALLVRVIPFVESREDGCASGPRQLPR
ncbi:MAG: hypothetical protein JWQ52_2550 [Phenylobacterium sp.]|nr:hypothetical protein [Phenylobacterium sp.]